MNTTRVLLFLNLFLWLSGCTAQTKPIGETPLNLSTFDFNTEITALYPEKNKSKNYKEYYNIPTKYRSQLVQKDTTFVDKYSEHKKAVGIEYRQQSSSNMDTLALFQSQAFNKLNIATALDNKIKVVCAVADEMSENENVKFINILSKKHGQYKKTEGEFGKKFFIYEWKTKDKIYRYSTVFNDEGTTIKIVIDKANKVVTQGEKEPHFEGYLYIIQKEYIDKISDLKTGDFVFID